MRRMISAMDRSLETSSLTACSRLSNFVRTSLFASRARSFGVTRPSSNGTSVARNDDFKTFSRNSNALSYTVLSLDCSPR